jgi:hypothetical protein
MIRFLLIFLFLMDYSWERLHNIHTVETLIDTVEEYTHRFPCEECREHFRELVETHPFPLENVQTREDIYVWTWFTHNLVNKRLGKEWYPLLPPAVVAG